jgi:hypothetical protein
LASELKTIWIYDGKFKPADHLILLERASVHPRALRFEPAAKPAGKDKFKAFGLSTKI